MSSCSSWVNNSKNKLQQQIVIIIVMPAFFTIFVGISKVYNRLNNFLNILNFKMAKDFWIPAMRNGKPRKRGKTGENVYKSESFVSWKILCSAKSVITAGSVEGYFPGNHPLRFSKKN